MEGPLLEGQQHRLIRITPRALREHVDALIVLLHLLSSTSHRASSTGAIRTIDEDGARKAHEPAQKRRALQRLLRRDAAVLGEDPSQHENVELGLVVADEDGRARRVEVVIGVLDGEGHSRGEPHDVLEAARGRPLRDARIADDAQDDRGDDSVAGADDEGGVGG
ncbi:hypothetical protein B7463_g1387, partial [Scytalidium lignicola]